MSDLKYEIVTTSAGATSIRDFATGEIMHNPVGPWVEANGLYIDQSNLDRRLTEYPSADELVIFDVGLGAAANALAVLHRARALSPRRPIRLISFERDLTLAHFALQHAEQFAHFAGFETALQTLLRDGTWSEPGVTWDLRLGDYNELIAREPHLAHLIFFEPYSPKKNADMWTIPTFAKTRRASSPDGCLLLTYSQSTPVRVALLMAGFYVGVGTSTGHKEETTQASVRLQDLSAPLGLKWLERWGRSHVQNAAGSLPAELTDVRAVILKHEQFNTPVA